MLDLNHLRWGGGGVDIIKCWLDAVSLDHLVPFNRLEIDPCPFDPGLLCVLFHCCGPFVCRNVPIGV